MRTTLWPQAFRTRPMGVWVLLAVILAALAAPAHADRLDLIEKRGSLIVGIKSDYPPFGMLDADGKLVGFEADLAHDIAEKMGLALDLRSVTSANRLQKLEDGAVDLIIATLGDTQQRRQIATLIEPNYYASGVNILTHKDSGITQWSDLRGRKVCATQGALYNKAMAQRYLLDLQVFNGTRDTKLALRDGRCVGYMYDDTSIANDLLQPEWQDYGMPLASAMISPWAIAIARAEKGGRLETILGNIVADWHRSGRLIALEAKAKLPPSDFLAKANTLWNAKEVDGQPVCQRLPSGAWPVQCRNKALLSSTDVGGLYGLSLMIREKTGLNITLLHDHYDQRLFLTGLLTTLEMVLVCIVGSVAIGFAGAALMRVRNPVVRGLTVTIATFARMTPPLLQIYVVFFGIGSYVVTRYGWSFDGFVVAAAALSLYAGASNAFSIATALNLAAPSHGGNPRHYRTEVFRLAYVPVMAASVNVVKATGMASTIAVPELIYASTSILAEQGNADVMINLLMLVYFLIVLAVVRLFSLAERRIMGSAVSGVPAPGGSDGAIEAEGQKS